MLPQVGIWRAQRGSLTVSRHGGMACREHTPILKLVYPLCLHTREPVVGPCVSGRNANWPYSYLTPSFLTKRSRTLATVRFLPCTKDCVFFIFFFFRGTRSVGSTLSVPLSVRQCHGFREWLEDEESDLHKGYRVLNQLDIRHWHGGMSTE